MMLAWVSLTASAFSWEEPPPTDGRVWWMRGADVMSGAGLDRALGTTVGVRSDEELGTEGAAWLGDIDGDGIPEWWVPGAYRPFVLEATGRATSDDAPGLTSAFAAVGDIDGDGIEDVAAVVSGLSVEIVAGASLGAPLPSDRIRTTVRVPTGSSGVVRLGDIDGDGFDELGVTARERAGEDPWRVWTHIFRGPVTNAVDGEHPWATLEDVWVLDGADFDGDGLSDLVGGDRPAGAPRWIFDGARLASGGALHPRNASARLLGPRGSPLVGRVGTLDADADGATDLLVRSESPFDGFEVVLYRGTSLAGRVREPDLSFRWRHPSTADPMGRVTVVGFPTDGGDLDGDARDELVIVAGSRDRGSAEVLVFPGASLPWGGTLGPRDAVARIAGWRRGLPSAVAVGDADGDGVDDLLLGDRWAAP